MTEFSVCDVMKRATPLIKCKRNFHTFLFYMWLITILALVVSNLGLHGLLSK